MASPLDAAQFRELCGRFATGVVVVTASPASGAPAGMTANSFASVSLEPPLVSVNVDRGSEFHAVIERAASFAINVLSQDQEWISRRFAASASNRFDGVGYRRSERGSIVLAGVVAVIECETLERIPVGDHTIVIGRVVGGDTHDLAPLLYYRGGYRTLG
ncbi:MAG: flavin reductase family protein [Gemmatimonadetes bacterium]|nr:flavin reductase family protein [Gemmatimonadota bacterium]